MNSCTYVTKSLVSYGLYSYGRYSYGLYSYGLYSYGLHVGDEVPLPRRQGFGIELESRRLERRPI